MAGDSNPAESTGDERVGDGGDPDKSRPEIVHRDGAAKPQPGVRSRALLGCDSEN